MVQERLILQDITNEELTRFSRSLRGTGGNVIICEECAFMKAEAFYEIVVPLMTIDECAFIAISTLSTNQVNHFGDLIKYNLVATLNISLACDSCRRMKTAEMCKHRMGEIPPWSSTERREWTQQVLGTGRADQYKREIMGVDDAPSSVCFPIMKIESLFANPPSFVPASPTRHIFVAIDPCGGSDIREKAGSDFCIMAMNNAHAILAMDAIDAVRQQDYEPRVESLFDALKRRWPMATFIVAIENNLAMEHARIATHLREQLPGRLVLMSDKEIKGGVATTNPVKREMMERTRLLFNQDKISFIQGMHTDHPKPFEMMREFREQLCRYMEYRKVSDNPLGKSSVGWSGKGNSGKQRDDMAVTLQLVIHHSHEFWSNPKYERFQRSM